MTIIHRMAEFHFWESLANIIKVGLFLLDPATKHYNVSCCIDFVTPSVFVPRCVRIFKPISCRGLCCGVSGSHERILKPIVSIDNHTLYLRYIAYSAAPDRCYCDALSLLDSQQVDAK